ncbi:hypothetical protein AURDEDRAFT_172189 [Auricularia subglabra TFB-10046 SS5]|nr:hypothetical protein AURDEDRAFT_172189 [Auricularia subglabra TFB-10046 SS5]
MLPFLPPEIKCHIAMVCDKSTQTKLALVDRLWAAETEPALYRDVALHITSQRFAAARACLRLLVSRPNKASCVRFLLFENSPLVSGALADVCFPAFLAALAALHALTDLRVPWLQWGSESAGSQLAEFCRFLGGRDCPFRLHNLLSINVREVMRPDELAVALNVHADTLRVVAFVDMSAFPVWSDDGIHDWFRELALPCATFAYAYGVREPYWVFITTPDADAAASIAASLEGNPLPADVGVLELRAAHLPSPALAAHFPRATEVRLILPHDQALALDPSAVAAAVAPLAHLSALILKSQDVQSIPSIPMPQRVEIARAAYAAGCAALSEVYYPDRSWLQLLATPTGTFTPTYGEPVSRFEDGDIEYAFGYRSDGGDSDYSE